MRKDTLYVSDLDGTLLGSDSRISARSSQIIGDLTARGAAITVATARTPATVVPLLASTPTLDLAVVMTGCAFWNRALGRLENTHFVPGHDLEAAMDICRRAGVTPFVYVLSPAGDMLDVYHDAPVLNKAERSFYEERANLKLKKFHLGTPAPARALEATMLCFAMGPREPIARAAEGLQEATGCAICCYPDIFNADVWNLEIFPPGVSKAAAVEELKAHTGARRLVVFGDSLNDLPMMAVADVAVAMGNALPRVKEAADIVIEPNYTDAVARFIEADFEG